MSTSTRIVAADYVVMPVYMLLTGITANPLFAWTPGKPGRIVSLDFVVHVVTTTASDAATVTPAIGGTSTTGGAVALTSANTDGTPGDKVEGSDITAANKFDADDEITLVGSSVTAFAEGSGYFMLAVEFGTID